MVLLSQTLCRQRPSCESQRGVAGRRFVSEVRRGCQRLLLLTAHLDEINYLSACGTSERVVDQRLDWKPE